MPRYTSLLGRRVELFYRFCGIEMFVSGVVLGHSGDSILIEQHADQYGGLPKFQLAIPFSWILSLSECNPDRTPGTRSVSRN